MSPPLNRIETVLADAFGGPVRIAEALRPGPWPVLRCILDGPAGAPPSVAVKYVRSEAVGRPANARQMATEHAGLTFLGELGFPRAPRPLAADPEGAFLVLEDLHPRTSLAEQIRHAGPVAARAGLVAFAQAMGELSAATAGRLDAYRSFPARFGATQPVIPWLSGPGRDWRTAVRSLDAAGLPFPAAVEPDLALTVATLDEPGPFLAFSNGDAEANNCLVSGHDARLIDFEGAGFRHALTNAVWMHVPGPAWMNVRTAFNDDLEAEFRRALAAGAPEAEDDARFGLAMAAAGLAWALERLTRFPRIDARPPGDASRVQMISVLESASALAAGKRSLPALAGWTEAAAAWLRRRWPDADVDLSAIGAYAPRS